MNETIKGLRVLQQKRLLHSRTWMDFASEPRVAVPPTRIAQMGIGSFLVLLGGAMLLLCYAGSMLAKNPTRTTIQLIVTVANGIMIAFLVVSDVDNTWLVRIFVGLTVGVGCVLGIFAVFKLNICATVVAREIVSENDQLIRRRRRKFLF
ncbi:hypothetical protein ACHAXA_003460 [Cyclostephanos tholiformis]|uniref:Uncharacterized protein n=1 Tax=Cyclostephanos tholiformis TaxID=382380 RepID=A0ABD3R1C7_9STRA